MRVENVRVMLPPQSDAETKKWKISSLHDAYDRRNQLWKLF
jgi:hypothetical protein